MKPGYLDLHPDTDIYTGAPGALAPIAVDEEPAPTETSTGDSDTASAESSGADTPDTASEG